MIEIVAVNITFEYDEAYGGFVFRIVCNYPESPVKGEVLFDNHTLFFREEVISSNL